MKASAYASLAVHVRSRPPRHFKPRQVDHLRRRRDGFLFDIYVVLVGPLILQPALTELGHLRPGTPEYRDWAGYLFWIPPLVGGFCGLWGGYLADRFGRRRILTYSILVYAFSATASGLAASR